MGYFLKNRKQEEKIVFMLNSCCSHISMQIVIEGLGVCVDILPGGAIDSCILINQKAKEMFAKYM